MKKIIFFTLLFIFFRYPLYGEGSFDHFFVFSSGYSILHDYKDNNHSGFNFSLNYEPGLMENLHVDISLSFSVHKKQEGSAPLFRSNYDFCHSPSISLGPKYYLPFLEKFKPFGGAGIHLTVSISRDHVKNETPASFSPGVYVKTGFDYFWGRKFFTGFETYYKWCFADIPHSASFKLRLGYVY